MSRSRRVIRGVAVVGVALLAAVSCADDSESPETTGPAQDPGTGTPAVEPVETVSLDMWVEDVDMACEEATAASASITEPQTEADVAPALDMAAESAMELTDSIIAAGAPDEQLLGALTYIDYSWQVTDVLAGAAVTAQDDPQAALAEVQAVEPVAVKADAVARDLGITACYEGDPTEEAELLDVEQIFDDPAVPENEEEADEAFAALGLNAEEARCMAQRLEDLIAAAALDTGSDEAILEIMLECGIDVERIVEVFGG